MDVRRSTGVAGSCAAPTTSAAAAAAAAARLQRGHDRTNTRASAAAAAAAMIPSPQREPTAVRPSAFGVMCRISREPRPSNGSRASSPQIVWWSGGFGAQTSVRPSTGSTERTVRAPVSRGRRANAGPRPSARKGSAGTTNRGPSFVPPYGTK